MNASRLLDQVPPARLPISRSRFLLGPDRPPTLLYTLEDAFSLTRHPIAPDAGLLLITWSRDLSRTSAFGEESRWVEIELGLQGGQYALRPHRFEPGRDFAADDGHGGVRVTARADRPAALEILYRGDQVDAIVTLRRGGRWDEGFWRLAGKEHEAPLDGDGLRIPLAGRPRSIDLIRFGDPAAFPAAEPALDAPIVRGFPDTSVFAAIVDRFPESPEIETAIERAARGRDAAFLRRVAHLHTGPAADAWRERAALAPGAGAADWRAALRARRLAGDAEGALTLFSKAPERFGPELDEERGRLLRALGRWSEAAEAFSSARVRGDTSLDLLIAEAECRRKSKEADTARFLLDQALKRDAQHSRALREWVRLNEESAPNEALRALEQLSVTEPNDPWVALRLALTLHALGDDEAARRALERFFEFEAPEAMTARARRLAEKLVRSPG